MTNIRIIVKGENYIVVVADSERFGKNEIMYEGNCFRECFNYIKRETGRDSLTLNGTLASLCEDRKGETFPSYMEVR